MNLGPARTGALAALLCLVVTQGHLLLGSDSALDHGVLGHLERQSLDLRFRLRGPEPITENLVVVALDDASLREMGPRLEKRTGFGELITAIRADGARVIAVDAIFTDEEHVLPPALVADLRAALARSVDDTHPPLDQGTRALLQRVLAEEDGDKNLARAFKGDDVVLAMHAGERLGFSELRPDLTKATYGQAVPGPVMPFVATRVVASLPMFHEAAARLGLATIVVDADDQTARTLHVGRTFQQRILMPFSVQIAAAARGISRDRLAYDAASHTLHLGEHVFTTGADHGLIVNHRGGNDAVEVISAADVLEDRVGDRLKDAIVIVGYTELGQDTVRTPYSPQLPGAALHATMVSNLLRGDPLRRAGPWLEILLVILAGLVGASLFWARLPLGPFPRVLLTLAIGGGWWVVAVVAFGSGQLWLPVVAPLTTLAVTAVAGLAAAYGTEGVLRLRLRRTFAHYLADDVIEELLENPASLALGGERRELTVLFSDICGFTTLAEQMEPLELVRFLNTYFTPMTRAVLDNRGLLDKYIGDAVMAVFGAPLKNAVHADDALACVLTMYQRLQELRVDLKKEGRDLQIGIGLNSGEMVVGNMGSAERFDYTVAGDAVNLASRIEGLTRAYGCFCLVGEATRRRANPRFRFRQIDLVTVKGKLQPAAFFEFLGDETTTIVQHDDLDTWEVGRIAYHEGDFPSARTALEAFIAKNPDDVAASVLLERMAAMGAAPADWQGVYRHTSKS